MTVGLFFQTLLLPVLAMVILYAFMARVVPLRRGWRWRVPIALAVAAALSLLKVYWGIFSQASFLLRLAALPIMLAILPLWLFQGPVWRTLLVNILFYCAQMLGEALCVQLFIPPDAVDYIDAFYASMPPSQLLVYGALSQGSAIILDIALVILARSLTARRFSPIYLPALFLPFCLWGMMMGHFMNLGSWVWFLCMLLGGGTTAILLYYIVSLEEKDALADQVRELRHAMELEQARYRTVEERREELARIRHDFNNQLTAIGRLVEGGETEDARRMIALLREDIDSTREAPYCAIPVVNAVLEEKALECRRRGVALRVNLEFPPAMSVEPLHLCSIFANLMDNAIRGAEASGASAPGIALTSKVSGDYLFIKTVNPDAAAGAPAARGGGYGIRILNDIAGRYEGSYISASENGFFRAQVSLLAVPEDAL